MNDNTVLRQKAHQAIQAGKLPRYRPQRMWGGWGTGACCMICDKPVGRDEVEYELQFAQDHDGSDRANFHVHLLCLAAWEVVCRNFDTAAGDGLPSDQQRLVTPPVPAGGASASASN
jgi:hypothetical protein